MSKRVNNKRGNRAKRKMANGQTTKVRGHSHAYKTPGFLPVVVDYPMKGESWLDMEMRIQNYRVSV